MRFLRTFCSKRRLRFRTTFDLCHYGSWTPLRTFGFHKFSLSGRGSTEEYLVEWVDNDAAVDAEDEQLHSNDPPPTVAPTVALSDQYQTWEPIANIPGTAALINKCREAIAEANLLREQETQKKKH